MVDIVAASVAAHVRDAPLVIVAGRHAGVAVKTGVVLTGVHELLEVGVLAGWGWGHAVVRVGGVGCEGGGWGGGWDEQRLARRRRVFVLSKVIHGWAYACEYFLLPDFDLIAV